jgi:hypothetical protein
VTAPHPLRDRADGIESLFPVADRIAYRWARRLHGASIDRDDLVQAGRLAVWANRDCVMRARNREAMASAVITRALRDLARHALPATISRSTDTIGRSLHATLAQQNEDGRVRSFDDAVQQLKNEHADNRRRVRDGTAAALSQRVAFIYSATTEGVSLDAIEADRRDLGTWTVEDQAPSLMHDLASRIERSRRNRDRATHRGRPGKQLP